MERILCPDWLPILPAQYFPRWSQKKKLSVHKKTHKGTWGQYPTILTEQAGQKRKCFVGQIVRYLIIGVNLSFPPKSGRIFTDTKPTNFLWFFKLPCSHQWHCSAIRNINLKQLTPDWELSVGHVSFCVLSTRLSLVCLVWYGLALLIKQFFCFYPLRA